MKRKSSRKHRVGLQRGSCNEADERGRMDVSSEAEGRVGATICRDFCVQKPLTDANSEPGGEAGQGGSASTACEPRETGIQDGKPAAEGVFGARRLPDRVCVVSESLSL